MSNSNSPSVIAGLLSIHAILSRGLKVAVEKASAEPGTADPLIKINLVLRRLEELWHPHIGIEEEHFTIDRFAALMPPEEHLRLNALFLEHAQRHWGAEYLMLPFLLYNLAPDKRSFFAAEMPPIVTEQLVPIVWKEKWAPMQPFLLA